MAEVSRYWLLDGQQTLDPLELDQSQRDGSPDDFIGRATSVRCPIGREAGTATLCLSRTAGDALGRNDAHTITCYDNGTPTIFKGYYIDRMYQANVDGDQNGAWVVELVDKRQILRMSAINSRYNCLKPLPYTPATQIKSKYFTDSLSGGTALYTWAQVWTDLWGKLPSIAGAAPSLPYTPAGNPKNLAYNGSAWECACDFLALLTCAITYNPIAETFGIARLSQAQSGFTDAKTAADASTTNPLLYDSKDKTDCSAAGTPASFKGMFPQQHPNQDDNTRAGYEVDTSSGVSGAVSGTVEPYFERGPETYCDIGGGQNTSELDTRGGERGQELSGKATNSDKFSHLEYSGIVTSMLCGSQVSEVAWRDYGDDDGLRTEIDQRPLKLAGDDRSALDLDVDQVIRCRLDAILVTGGSASATVVVYDWDASDWLPDVCTLTVYDSLDIAPADVGVPQNVEVWVKYNHDSEKYELLAFSKEIVYFQLTAQKDLSTQPVTAVILRFNGTAWASSGITINVYDNYYPDAGFFTGKNGIDRGWAKLRKKNEPTSRDDYELIWMSGPCHVIEFLLEADRTAGDPAPTETVYAGIIRAYLYGHESYTPEGAINIPVRFPATYFPFAKEGAKGTAVYDDESTGNREYRVVQCDQLCLTATAILSVDLCGGASATVEEFDNASQWPFSQIPAAFEGGAAGGVLNLYGHRGKAGDLVALMFIQYLEEYCIIDVEKKSLNVVEPYFIAEDEITGLPVLRSYTTTIATEYCTDPVVTDIDGDICDPGSGSG
jgi:hypothetical protein